jgi:hypothetical protein
VRVEVPVMSLVFALLVAPAPATDEKTSVVDRVKEFLRGSPSDARQGRDDPPPTGPSRTFAIG